MQQFSQYANVLLQAHKESHQSSVILNSARGCWSEYPLPMFAVRGSKREAVYVGTGKAKKGDEHLFADSRRIVPQVLAGADKANTDEGGLLSCSICHILPLGIE